LTDGAGEPRLDRLQIIKRDIDYSALIVIESEPPFAIIWLCLSGHASVSISVWRYWMRDTG
jgi:hypothetical protein